MRTTLSCFLFALAALFPGIARGQSLDLHVDTGSGYQTSGSADVGAVFTYRLQYQFPSAGVTYSNARAEIRLPSGVTYLAKGVSPHVASSTYLSGSRTVVFDFHPTLPSSFSGDLLVSVRFQGGTLTGSVGTASGDLFWDANGSAQSTASADVDVTATNGSNPPSTSEGIDLDYWKSANPAYLGSGYYYSLRHGNRGASDVDNYVVEQHFPKEFIFEYWRHNRRFKQSHPVQVRYQTTAQSTWVLWPGAPFDVQDGSSKHASSLGLAPGEYVTKLQFDYGTVPAGLDYHHEKAPAQLFLMGEISTKNGNGQPNDVHGNPIAIGTNFTGSGTLSANGHATLHRSSTSRIDPDLAEPYFRLNFLTGGPYNQNEIVRARLTVQSPPVNVLDLQNPTIVSLLPPELEYVGNVTANRDLPNIYAQANWNGSGQTLVRFQWNAANPLTITPNTEWIDVNVDFDLRVASWTADGRYDTTTMGWVSNPSHGCQYNNEIVDSHDVDSDGNHSDVHCGMYRSFEVFRDSTTEAATVVVSDSFVTEGDAVAVRVSLTAPNATDVIVSYATRGQTAQSDADFVDTSGNLTIPAGETTTTLTVPTIQDLFVEREETFLLILTEANGAPIADDDALITIIDDDQDVDKDGDGLVSLQDWDDDNDGILDRDEGWKLQDVDAQLYLQMSGDASAQANEVTLTHESNDSAGKAMSTKRMDLNYDMRLDFQIYLGDRDADGADGMAFVLHNDPAGTSALGANGYGLGAHGIQNGIALEFDTYQNRFDSSDDHTVIWDTDTGVAVNENWDTAPDFLSVAIAHENLEDGQWHAVTVTWDARAQTLAYTLDGVIAGQVTADLASDYLDGSRFAYFGWTGSTGLHVNHQAVRVVGYEGEFDDAYFLQRDTDGDGLPDHCDLDSDNDGIADVIEAGGDDPDNDAIVGAGAITDVDGDGVHDGVDDVDGGHAAQEVTTGTPLALPNSDSTGRADWRDIDADDDGIPDNVEAQATASYRPPRGVDADGDGLDDAYDRIDGWDPDGVLGSVGFAAGEGLIPVNTDASGAPDYLDLDSDNDSDLDAEENGLGANYPSGDDSDGDGLDDAFDTVAFGWDANDRVDDPNPSTLGDKDGDLAADGSDAFPMVRDVDFRDPEKPNTFGGWQSVYAAPLQGEIGPHDNPDGDLYTNLLEYAICLHPVTGLPGPGGFFVDHDGTSSTSRFYRPVGGLGDITYEIHALRDLPVLESQTWTVLYSISGSGSAPAGVVVTNLGNGIEEVSVPDLAMQAPLTQMSGFLRLAVRYGDEVSYGPVWGWTETVIEEGHQETYANPFTDVEVLAGKIDGLAGTHGINVASALGGALLEREVDFSGASFYIEIIDGTLEGHRFDVVHGAGSILTLANDSDLHQGPPFNTMVTPVAIPSALTDGRFVLRAHRTLDHLFPPASGAFTPQAHTFVEGHPADRITLFRGDWQSYWLYDHGGGTPHWDLDGDAMFTDAGSTIIAPDHGMFVAPQETTVVMLASGMVRKHAFAMPLPQGWALRAGGFPLDQSAAERAMNQHTFDGSDDPTASDSICFWLGDHGTYLPEFRCAFLFEPATTETPRWVYADDDFLTPRDFEKSMFPRDRSSFYYRHLAPKADYVLPLAWCIDLIGE